MIYNLAFSNKLTNTALALVDSGLISGHCGGWYPSGFGPSNEISPKADFSLQEFLYTNGDGGTEGFIRLYPTLEGKAVPPSIPDSETLYIGWNISGSGAATYTLTAPSLYKLTNVAEMSFDVIGAFGLDTCQEGYVWREAFAGDSCLFAVPPSETYGLHYFHSLSTQNNSSIYRAFVGKLAHCRNKSHEKARFLESPFPTIENLAGLVP
jgi:hypothetical protein